MVIEHEILNKTSSLLSLINFTRFMSFEMLNLSPSALVIFY